MQRQSWPHPKETCMSEDTTETIEKLRKIKERLGQKRTRAQKQRFAQEYLLLSKEVKKRCNKDKRNYSGQQAKYVEKQP